MDPMGNYGVLKALIHLHSFYLGVSSRHLKTVLRPRSSGFPTKQWPTASIVFGVQIFTMWNDEAKPPFEGTNLFGETVDIFWLVVWNIFVFPYIGNNHPNWLIFFRGVETTSQLTFFNSPIWRIYQYWGKWWKMSSFPEARLKAPPMVSGWWRARSLISFQWQVFR